MAYQINIKNSASAKAWVQEVQAIDQDCKAAMDEAGQVLVEMKGMSEGTVVDELVFLGDGFLTCSIKVFEAVDEIADTVADVLKDVGDFVDEAKEKISNVFGQLFG